MVQLILLVLAILTVVGAQSLQDSLNGTNAVFPSDAQYAAASAPFNLRYDYKPAVIVYPTTIDEISQVVKVGAAHNYSIVARSGGHSYIAAGTGGENNSIVIDLSKNTQIIVDDASGTAVIQTGNRLGNVASELNSKGRALPHGSCAYVGIGGHAAFGGFGFQSRMWGLTLDTIQSAALVLPNGTITTVSSSSYPDLFWAVRGSAPSFGIVYNATYKTFAAPTNNIVYQIGWAASIADASAIISAWQSFALSGDLPPTFGGEINASKGKAKGQISISLFCAFWGPPAEFDPLIQKFLTQVPATAEPTSPAKNTTGAWLDALGAIMGDLSTEKPDGTDTFYAKSLLTPEASPMTNDTITSYVTYLANDGFDSDTAWFTQIEFYGGTQSVINSPSVDSTSFARRDILFNFQLYASSSDHKPPYPDDGFNFVDGMVNSIVSKQPSGWNYSMYTNYVEDRLSNWQELYYGNHYAKLQEIKRSIDPNNVFRFPTSIELTSSGNGTKSSSQSGNFANRSTRLSLSDVTFWILGVQAVTVLASRRWR